MITPRRPRPWFGSLVPAYGQSRCYRCRLPWWANRSQPRSVPYAADYDAQGRAYALTGMFALCQRCWQRSTHSQRLRAHRWVHHVSTPEREWEPHEQAVANHDGLPPDTDVYGGLCSFPLSTRDDE